MVGGPQRSWLHGSNSSVVKLEERSRQWHHTGGGQTTRQHDSGAFFLIRWEFIDHDQGTCDSKIKLFLRFTEGVTPMMRKKVLNEIHQGLDQQSNLIQKCEQNANCLCRVMEEHANVPRETIDIKWWMQDCVRRTPPPGEPAVPIALASLTT